MSDDTQKSFWSKSIFVFATVAFCLGVAARMGFDQTLTSRVSEIVADGLISLSMFVAISYLAAQAVDPSVVSAIMGRRGKKVPDVAASTYQTVDPSEFTDGPGAKG